jgi:hypothetical protein
MNERTTIEPAPSWLRARLEIQRVQFSAARLNQTASSNELDAIAKQLEQAAQAARNAARDALVRELAESLRLRPGSSEILDY